MKKTWPLCRVMPGRVFFAALLLLCLALLALPQAALAADQAEVKFQAGEADGAGNFTLTMRVSNACFNVFQFVLRYDPATVRPVKAGGTPAASFGDCAELAAGIDWLSEIGTGLDAEAGLIDFTGYVTPGRSYHTADKAAIEGKANTGADGVELYTFRFQRVGDQAVVIELAEKSGAKPYREYIPEGGGLADAGYSLPASFRVELPASLGESKIVTVPGNVPPGYVFEYDSPQAGGETALSRGERLQDTVMLQIGNYAAALEGRLVHINPGEPDVMPYIKDSRTLVPLRFIAESLGCEVDWDNANRTAIVIAGETIIRMPIGSQSYTVNGMAHSMDTAAELTYNRTMVPIRFVAEALGKSVTWDNAGRLVFIAPLDRPWDMRGERERELMPELLQIISPLLRDLI